MKSINILKMEHDIIVKLLESLSIIQKKLETDNQVPMGVFDKTVDFTINFIDKFHHFKEEYLLFSLLAHKKNGDIDLAAGALRHQHERCRSFVEKISRSSKEYSAGNDIASTTLLENLAAFISVLKLHIHKEDTVFFDMIEKELTDEEESDILKQFQDEEKKLGSGSPYKHARKLIKEINSLL